MINDDDPHDGEWWQLYVQESINNPLVPTIPQLQILPNRVKRNQEMKRKCSTNWIRAEKKETRENFYEDEEKICIFGSFPLNFCSLVTQFFTLRKLNWFCDFITSIHFGNWATGEKGGVGKLRGSLSGNQTGNQTEKGFWIFVWLLKKEPRTQCQYECRI